jgi:hypothetical protein
MFRIRIRVRLQIRILNWTKKICKKQPFLNISHLQAVVRSVVDQWQFGRIRIRESLSLTNEFGFEYWKFIAHLVRSQVTELHFYVWRSETNFRPEPKPKPDPKLCFWSTTLLDVIILQICFCSGRYCTCPSMPSPTKGFRTRSARTAIRIPETLSPHYWSEFININIKCN